MENPKPFKKCGCCGLEWPDREVFLHDRGLSIIGYQANFHKLEEGLFLFNHTCDTTIALPVSTFLDLYQGPRYTERLTGAESCPKYCQYKDELRPCPNKCECSFVREILQIIGRQLGEKTAA